MRNIDPLLQNILATVRRHSLGYGAYARYLWQNAAGTRKMGLNEYGCADAMNLYYTLGAFPTGKEREDALSVLLSLQNPETGLFTEATHHPIHTTAHCAASLELFDAVPRYKQTALAPYFTIAGMQSLLDGLEWRENPWDASHKGAGIYAVGVLTRSVDLAWQNAYFRYLWDMTDPTFGMSRAGYLPLEITAENPYGEFSGTYSHLFGWFHYTFNMEYAHRPQRYPEKLIDTCITLYRRGFLRPAFGNALGFAEVDWVYVLNRASRQTPHRMDEVKAVLRHFAGKFLDYFESVDFETDDDANDLHVLFGSVCALAELMAALPGEIVSEKPLRLVLDRRPFI